jgi:hypothetical protein
LLAIGSLSKQFYDDTHELLQAILEADSPYERVLHRDLLFAAACVGDSVNVAPRLRQQIAGRLLSLYCDRRHAGRYRLLQNQVKEALLTLCNDQGDAAVETALAQKLTSCADRTALICALEAADWLEARTPRHFLPAPTRVCYPALRNCCALCRRACRSTATPQAPPRSVGMLCVRTRPWLGCWGRCGIPAGVTPWSRGCAWRIKSRARSPPKQSALA